VVSLTIARWPLQREHQRYRGPATYTTRWDATTVWRRLRDGSEHRVVKVYYTPGELAARLAELGWSADIRETSSPLLVGTAHRRTGDA
jgi:hypothetical protein